MEKWEKPKSTKRSVVYNPIRSIIESSFKIPPVNPPVPFLNLGLGEPSKKHGFPFPEIIKDAVKEIIDSDSHNGYTHSSGCSEAKQAVIKKFTPPDRKITENEVFITAGASGALHQILGALCEEGDNILIPQPGFTLCKTLCEGFGVDCKYYNLLPEREWEVDLEQVEKLADPKTRALVLINPSNPCGSVFTLEHMQQIIKVAEKLKLPIIADEIYDRIVYGDGKEFHSFGHITENVPVISIGALSKVYAVPGWRLGWFVVYNYHHYFDDVIDGMKRLSQTILHPNTLVQYALPKILEQVPESYYKEFNAHVKGLAAFAQDNYSKIKGLTPIKTSGAIYMMVKIHIDQFKDITDDLDFAKKLLEEQYVLVLPGRCFSGENYFRVVLCSNVDILEQVGERLRKFVAAHLKESN